MVLLLVETKAQSAASDNKVKHRLEQLDDMEEGSVKETLNLSQKDYIKKIDDLNRSLITAWDNDQRVKALKIAIQVQSSKGVGQSMKCMVQTVKGDSIIVPGIITYLRCA